MLNNWLKGRIYADYAGAMPVLKGALSAFNNSVRIFGNPGALHKEGVDAEGELSNARARIASCIGCKSGEIIFTSGGTEGNNLAILGFFNSLIAKGMAAEGLHFIVSKIEHPSVLECFDYIESRGASVSRIQPSPSGEITEKSIKDALRKETVFVSVGWANGEIGTVQPISKVSQMIRQHERDNSTKIVLHTDAGQVPLYISPQVHTIGADLVTFDGGKIGSVRGVGVLFVKNNTRISPIMHGGEQEKGLRPGTENVALAASLSAAFEEVGGIRNIESKRLNALRELFINKASEDKSLEGIEINGEGKQLPHIINVSIQGIDNEYIAMLLDRKGIAMATKSACMEGERESHVVRAIAGEDGEWRASTALRFSIGGSTRKKDILSILDALSEAVVSYKSLSK